ncbi:MAG: apolipoprotein N-acyltransferase [Pyrinomonadaceae bacterium]
MQDAIALDARRVKRRRLRLRERARACAPTLPRLALAAASSLLLILSFPDFNLWWLAWVGLAPLLVAVCAQPQPRPAQAFVLGWATGTLYFYGSCWWLTYSMIHFGGIPAWLAYPLLVPPTLVVGLFPALCCLIIARVASRLNTATALVVAPFAWVACEWARLLVTGQLWNAVGYTQAYHPTLIQSAEWGGVYAVGFLILTVNAALPFALLKRNKRAYLTATIIVSLVALTIWLNAVLSLLAIPVKPVFAADVIALQPNVEPNFKRTQAENDALVARHLSMSALAVAALDSRAKELAASIKTPDAASIALTTPPRVIIFPESPMNFEYARDAEFRELIGNFARQEHASIIFNSLEPAPAGGAYNSAVMVNEEGRLVAQYDKIRLLPFGEYVPLPRWLGGGLLGGLVGDFTPGANYTLLPLGQARAGVFICFESAFPSIARTFTNAGADVLINISNDGYLGKTPVLRQHLANVVFRAVENRRTILRVTNTGISTRITPDGEVLDATDSFQPATRTWTISRASGGTTFYTRHGDLFVEACSLFSLLVLAATWRRRGTAS